MTHRRATQTPFSLRGTVRRVHSSAGKPPPNAERLAGTDRLPDEGADFGRQIEMARELLSARTHLAPGFLQDFDELLAGIFSVLRGESGNLLFQKHEAGSVLER